MSTLVCRAIALLFQLSTHNFRTTDTIGTFFSIDDAACLVQPTELLGTVGGEPSAVEVVLAFPQALAIRSCSHIADETTNALTRDIAFLRDSFGSQQKSQKRCYPHHVCFITSLPLRNTHYPMIHARPLLSSGDDKRAYNDWAGMILRYRCVCRDDLALHLSVKTLIPLWEHRKVTHPSLGAS